jgi:DUF1680 family protein
MLSVAASILASGIAMASIAADEFTVVKTPPTQGRNSFYVGNRDPLEPSPLLKLPIGSIEPQGWLRAQLELMRDGMTGHMDQLSHWVKPENSAWLSKDGKGENGWEELPYWLKGVGDLGYVLKDERLTALAKRWCEGVMSAQRPDGYFGSEENRGGGPENMQLGAPGKLKGPDLWPHMPMLDALKSYHEATGDPRVIAFMTRYFKWEAALPKDQLLAESWQKIRGGDNLESVLWLYNRTGDAWLLDLARTLHERTAPWSQKVANLHGVNFCQGFREPAVYWQLSKDQKDLDAVERNYREMMGQFGQVPGGMFGADEIARPAYGDPRQAAETCSMVEFMNSFEQMLRFTGEGLYADRCEEVAFNSLPAAFTADYRGLHYLTSPNMVQLDRNSKAPGLMNDGTMISYDPGEVYRCCQHNHAMGWPYYAEHQWMATQDNGLAALLYGQCTVKAKVGDGQVATLREETAYPFGQSIVITLSVPRPTEFPIYLRVPGWCRTPVTSVGPTRVRGEGGNYIRLTRTWKDGDRIELALPMEISTTTWAANHNSVSVRRGPLWYSLKIGEKTQEYAGSSSWPATEVFPTTPWNYGLVLASTDASSNFRVEDRSAKMANQPFTAEDAPILVTAKARRIPQWQQDRKGLVGTLQDSPVRSTEPEQDVTLIPMGCARLRISAFPVIGEGPGAHEWNAPPVNRHDASYEYDDINAISDGKEPKNSNDHSIPRFTWWDHKGTSEWVTYRFDRPRRVSSCSLYWFDDTGVGQCRVPESWRVLYKEGQEWKPVAGADGYGIKPDQYNTVRFTPVQTTELKLEVTLQNGVSGGILEWKVGD